MGFYGSIYPNSTTRITYEIYGVNGLSNGVISSGSEGTRIANGKHNFEDNNNHPSLTGRIAVNPLPKLEFGISTHTGPYNNYDAEGISLDDKRNLSIFAIDGECSYDRYTLNGEIAWADIDIYPALRGIYAEKQWGYQMVS
jgi:hypothetical protein